MVSFVKGYKLYPSPNLGLNGSVLSVKENIMEITPIRTEKDFRAALPVVSTLVDQAGLSIKDNMRTPHSSSA